MKNWFKNSNFGLFIHWGIYSVLGGEYKGQKSSNYAEWIQSYFRIPNSEMEMIARTFHPTNFNADEIVSFAKCCGIKYIVFTAKHHDGFAMYNSKVDDYNICNYGFNRDVLKELSESCKKYNIKLGIYYSQDLDWHNKDGGGFKTKVEDCAGSSWDNNWDYKNLKKNFDDYFYNKALPQIKELFSNYGKISLAWFDVPFTLSKKQSQEIYNLVKELQPNCLINSRLGNGCYDYVNFGDNELPKNIIELKTINSHNNELNGVKKSLNGLYETCCTLNQSWGYTKYPKWKNIDVLRELKTKAQELGVNLLINIGLDSYGNIPPEAKNIIKNLSVNKKAKI